LERSFLTRLLDLDFESLRDFLRRWDRLRERVRDLERDRRDLDRVRVRRDLDLDRDLKKKKEGIVDGKSSGSELFSLKDQELKSIILYPDPPPYYPKLVNIF